VTVRDTTPADKGPHLIGFNLLMALIVAAAVALATLWITHSAEAAVVMVAPLLIIIGVDGVDRVREGASDDKLPHLTGGKLLIALIVVAAVALATLWMTGSPEAAVLVVAPLLIIIGVERHRR